MAALPPKSSNFRGVTLFKPSGKWRAQISAGGKTTSLGDHETEVAAARAFDRACINKAGADARTNFPLDEYADEMDQLIRIPTPQLVSLLRARARRQGAQTSRHRGVSLLRQTGRWHAQINVAGRQVHLGFFGAEELASRAYDRAAILKGVADTAKIVTNHAIGDYAAEIPYLAAVPPARLVRALTADSTRKDAMALLCNGFTPDGTAALFGVGPAPVSVATLAARSERAAPKHTSLDDGPLRRRPGSPSAAPAPAGAARPAPSRSGGGGARRGNAGAEHGAAALALLSHAARAATPERSIAPHTATTPGKLTSAVAATLAAAAASPSASRTPPRPRAQQLSAPATPSSASALWSDDGPEARVVRAARVTTARQAAVAARRPAVEGEAEAAPAPPPPPPHAVAPTTPAAVPAALAPPTPAVTAAPRPPRSPADGKRGADVVAEDEARRKRRKGAPTRAAV